uniref:Uncharacterized protein n=1 Tax=Oryza punctata TaxID=4537 RepID=A0A0E0M5C7_ORYPU
MACVYSSRTNTWVSVATIDTDVTFHFKSDTVLDNANPVALSDFIVILMTDGQLGYASMMGLIVMVFIIEDLYEDGYATWTEVAASTPPSLMLCG